jgi:hypothetical protein
MFAAAAAVLLEVRSMLARGMPGKSGAPLNRKNHGTFPAFCARVEANAHATAAFKPHGRQRHRESTCHKILRTEVTPMHLDRYLNRLAEVQEELAEIGEVLQDVVQEKEQAAYSESEARLAGFRAYHLAQEGKALLKLVSATLAVLRSSCPEDDTAQLERLDSVDRYLGDLDPVLGRIMRDMTSYSVLAPAGE